MPMRTPVGLPGGALSGVAPRRLISTVLSAVVGRSGIDPHRIDQLVTATPDAAAVRGAIPLAGLPCTLDEFAVGAATGGGLRALITAAMMVQTGSADVVLALGAEYPGPPPAPVPAQSPGAQRHPGVPRVDPPGGPRGDGPGGPRGNGPGGFDLSIAGGLRGNQRPDNRGGPGFVLRGGPPGPDTGEQLAVWANAETAHGGRESKQVELLAQHYGIGRAEADEFAAASHRRAARARRQGIFGAEIAPVVVNAIPDDANSGVVQLVDRDEGLRDDVSHRAFAALEPFVPGGVRTVGNCSARTLAASGCLVVAEDRLDELGLQALGYVVGWATATAEPDAVLPVAGVAMDRVLARNGLTANDLDLAEIDETSAVEVLALTRVWERENNGFDPVEQLNVHGAAIALGDPGNAGGLRMVTTLMHELDRRDGGFGLVAAPTGPGRALAALFESADAERLAPAPRGARFHGARQSRIGRGRHRG
ncbi:thiolase family protein [Nocardia sp. NPDC055321]